MATLESWRPGYGPTLSKGDDPARRAPARRQALPRGRSRGAERSGRGNGLAENWREIYLPISIAERLREGQLCWTERAPLRDPPGGFYPLRYWF